MIDTCVIFCGGKGTRLEEVTRGFVPKPLVPINNYPLIYLIMRYYLNNGVRNFYLLAGHQSIEIKKFVRDIALYDGPFSLVNGVGCFETATFANCKIHVVDTGEDTQTGGRLAQIEHLLDVENFYLTYGDGIADVDLKSLTQVHLSNNASLTLTSVNPVGRFGDLDISGEFVRAIREKTKQNTHWINGGFMVMEPEFLDWIDNDQTILEQQPLLKATETGNLSAFKHTGFWYCMDALRDRNELEELWQSGQAPWKIWDNL